MEPSVRVADFEAVERHRAVLQQRLCVDTELGDVSQQLVRTEPLGSSDVLKKIENVVKETLTYLAKGEAPVITFDKRSSWENIWFDGNVGLQMVSDSAMSKVKCECPRSIHRFALILKALAMIYKLVQSNTYATKRDLYYNESQLFGSQMILDGIINDISCMLKVPRRSLHVLSTSKGCIAGDLCYTEEDGNRVNCACNSTAILVPSNVDGIQNLKSAAKFVLVVEKDATFQRLLDDDFCTKLFPCIIITGKGVPDLSTRLMVRKLWDILHIPAFALVDADPHGIEIMCIYKYGSRSMSFDAHSLTVPIISWLGLLPSDIQRLNIPKEVLIPLTNNDMRKLSKLQKRPYVNCQPLWKKEMEIMETCKVKAEIQALESISSDYLTRVYLPNKLKFGGWI
ncbi:meiotic recombination protein SPO11 isoform X1 [Chiloscyllium plagiosum]|uniref:meiotic recombination protein SPO11 isoform X1 n=1 Tax=Chiloscyllium plagiosum TaxID=36176 RepID=UPI001CB83C09|nr:meiotic recombination protein SPO11 isoform X1 [Chiloscyllium plagiosum]